MLIIGDFDGLIWEVLGLMTSTNIISKFYSIKLVRSDNSVECESEMSLEYVLSRKLAALSIKFDYELSLLSRSELVFHDASFKLQVLRTYIIRSW